MDLLSQAPFLTTVAPFLLPIIIWILIKATCRPGRDVRQERAPPGAGAQVTSRPPKKESRGDPVKSDSGPQDEDDYVMLDDTINADVDSSDDPEPEPVPDIPFTPVRYPEEEMIRRSRSFFELLNKRRTVRMFSSEKIPREVINNIIRSAGTSPSGAHTEPWTYVVVYNQDLKEQIRDAIENEERVNYERRMGDKWLRDLRDLKTTWQKEYLSSAPCLLVVFKQSHSLTEEGQKKTHYYSEISISISVGLMLAAIQNAGLVTVTSTPMNAGPSLRQILSRPMNEKVIVLLPLGYAAADAMVPDFKRKPLEDIMVEM